MGLFWMCSGASRASSRVETGMSGNFLSCSKGVKDPLEVPEFRCDQLSLQGPHNEIWPTSHSSPMSYPFNCLNKERMRYMLVFSFLSCSNQ